MMPTHLPQNQFYSAPHVPDDADEAGASAPAPTPDAPAEISDGVRLGSLPSGESDPSVMLDFALSGTEAAVTVRAAAASDISDIGEIFRFAHQLCREAREFIPDYPGIYQAMLDENAPRALQTDPVWADPAPIFLKDTA